MAWRCRFMCTSAVPKSTQKVVHRVVVGLLRFLRRDDRQIMMFDPDDEWSGMLRRGAATDLMEQVGDALAAPRVASVAGEKSMWWSPEKDVRTKKADQSGQVCETGRTIV